MPHSDFMLAVIAVNVIVFAVTNMIDGSTIAFIAPAVVVKC